MWLKNDAKLKVGQKSDFFIIVTKLLYESRYEK